MVFIQTRPAGNGRCGIASGRRLPLRALAAAMLASLLGGCAIPPALAVASYLGDGVLMAATGKSSTDFGLSLATGRDCATLRLLKQENICRDNIEAQPEAVPVEVAADEAAQQKRVEFMPADEADRARLSEDTLAAAFHPLAGDAIVPLPADRTALAALLPRPAADTTVVAGLAAAPPPRLADAARHHRARLVQQARHHHPAAATGHGRGVPVAALGPAGGAVGWQFP